MAGSVRWRIALLEAPAGALILLAGWWAIQVPTTVAPAPGDVLALAARWLVVPGLCLLLGLTLTAASRWNSADAIDGRTADVPPRLEILLRYNRNTLEQAALVVLAWPALALAEPLHAARLLPALGVLFALGRVSFLLGYQYAPWARAFGFALTFYPTFAVYLWLVAGLFG